MSKTNEKAFPHTYMAADQVGMDLRDYFAARAMQALVTTPQMYDLVNDSKSCAREAYNIADAMMEQRELKNKSDE